MSEPVLVEHRGNAALITLNRPDKLNALDYALIDRLLEVLDIAEDDDEVRAIVLTGAGERAFCSGADIACFAPSVRRGATVALREFVRRGQRLTSRIENFPKPVIVAVNGLAHLAIEASYFARMAGTRDIEEGISAWLTRRVPQFTGT